jgi:outer membrane protein
MIAALAVGLAIAGFPDSAATPITLAEAVRLAQQNAPAAIAAHGQVRNTSASVRSAYGAFLPNLNVSAGASRQLPAQAGRTRIDDSGNVVVLPADPWSYNVGFSASMSLFEGGRRFFDLRQAKARSSAAHANEIAQSFDVAFAVKQQYYAVLANREAEGAARAQLEQAEEQRTFSIAKVRAQNATRSDSLRAEIQVRNAQNQIADALNGIATAEAALTRTVGTPYLVTASESDTLSPPPVALTDDQLRELADQSPNVIEAQKAYEAAKAAKKASFTDYLPSISMGYSRGGSGTSPDPFDPLGTSLGYNGSIRFSVGLPLFNQVQREAQVVGADVALQNAEAQVRDAQLAARSGLTSALGGYRTAEQKLEAQVLTVEAAEEDLRVQRRRYELGGSTLLDVLSSQAQLDQARLDLIRARFDMRVARAQLETIVGREL